MVFTAFELMTEVDLKPIFCFLLLVWEARWPAFSRRNGNYRILGF